MPNSDSLERESPSFGGVRTKRTKAPGLLSQVLFSKMAINITQGAVSAARQAARAAHHKT